MPAPLSERFWPRLFSPNTPKVSSTIYYGCLWPKLMIYEIHTNKKHINTMTAPDEVCESIKRHFVQTCINTYRRWFIHTGLSLINFTPQAPTSSPNRWGQDSSLYFSCCMYQGYHIMHYSTSISWCWSSPEGYVENVRDRQVHNWLPSRRVDWCPTPPWVTKLPIHPPPHHNQDHRSILIAATHRICRQWPCCRSYVWNYIQEQNSFHSFRRNSFGSSLWENV